MSDDATISVIIPALNEEGLLQSTLEGCRRPGIERIVVDGGSTDRTTVIAEAAGASVFRETGGRARQLNLGAAHASGAVLIFLHADTLLPTDFPRHVRNTLNQQGTAAGAFRLAIAGSGWQLRLIEKAANARSRFLQLPYGDQALFLTVRQFHAAGGFRPLPIMEDFDLVRRLGRLGRIRLAPAAVQTSSRRWRRRGPWRTTMINQLMVLRYLAGTDPETLAAFYRGTPRQSSVTGGQPESSTTAHDRPTANG